MGIEDADQQESNPKTSRPLISKLRGSLAGTSESIKIQKETLAHRVYGGQGGLKFVGRNDDGAIRLIELEGHRYFIASLFLPQMNSDPGRPHPMIVKYLEAALNFRQNTSLKRNV